MEKFLKGQQIETTVVQISADSVFVDLNSKSEGIIDKAEFIDSDGKLKIQEGDKIKVFYLGEINGEFRFTSRLSSENSDSDMLENAFQNKIPVEGKVEKEFTITKNPCAKISNYYQLHKDFTIFMSEVLMQ